MQVSLIIAVVILLIVVLLLSSTNKFNNIFTLTITLVVLLFYGLSKLGNKSLEASSVFIQSSISDKIQGGDSKTLLSLIPNNNNICGNYYDLTNLAIQNTQYLYINGYNTECVNRYLPKLRTLIGHTIANYIIKTVADGSTPILSYYTATVLSAPKFNSYITDITQIIIDTYKKHEDITPLMLEKTYLYTLYYNKVKLITDIIYNSLSAANKTAHDAGAASLIGGTLNKYIPDLLTRTIIPVIINFYANIGTTGVCCNYCISTNKRNLHDANYSTFLPYIYSMNNITENHIFVYKNMIGIEQIYMGPNSIPLLKYSPIDILNINTWNKHLITKINQTQTVISYANEFKNNATYTGYKINNIVILANIIDLIEQFVDNSTSQTYDIGIDMKYITDNIDIINLHDIIKAGYKCNITLNNITLNNIIGADEYIKPNISIFNNDILQILFKLSHAYYVSPNLDESKSDDAIHILDQIKVNVINLLMNIYCHIACEQFDNNYKITNPNIYNESFVLGTNYKFFIDTNNYIYKVGSTDNFYKYDDDKKIVTDEKGESNTQDTKVILKNIEINLKNKIKNSLLLIGPILSKLYTKYLTIKNIFIETYLPSIHHYDDAAITKIFKYPGINEKYHFLKGFDDYTLLALYSNAIRSNRKANLISYDNFKDWVSYTIPDKILKFDESFYKQYEPAKQQVIMKALIKCDILKTKTKNNEQVVDDAFVFDVSGKINFNYFDKNLKIELYTSHVGLRCNSQTVQLWNYKACVYSGKALMNVFNNIATDLNNSDEKNSLKYNLGIGNYVTVKHSNLDKFLPIYQ